jgi:Leucine-rich repeat (LRR) protein
LILEKNVIKRIAFIPNENFPALETLNLSHNYISTISKGAFDCQQLHVLCLSYNLLRKLDHLGVPSLLSLDVSHNRIVTVDEVEKLRACTQLLQFTFADNPLTQRVSPRIRCLCLLRSLTEMDGRQVTETDLSQVRLLLDQNDGLPPPSTSSRVAKVNTVILQPGLPQLTPPNPTIPKRKPGR